MRFYSDLFQGIGDSIRFLGIDYTPNHIIFFKCSHLRFSPVPRRRSAGSYDGYDYDVQSVKRAQKVQKVSDGFSSFILFISGDLLEIGYLHLNNYF